MAALSPWNEPLRQAFAETWDGDYLQGEAVHLQGAIGDIEKACIRVWKDLEECITTMTDHNCIEANWSLRRWSSSFFIHIGAVVEGASAWQLELEEFITSFEVVKRLPSTRTFDDKMRLRECEKQIALALASPRGKDGGDVTVRLADTVLLGGEWVSRFFKPHVVADESSGSLAIAVSFGEKSQAERAVLTAELLVWLSLRTSRGLDPRCIPQSLLVGLLGARERAASRGDYAYEPNDVELMVDEYSEDLLTARSKYRLLRIDGEVKVDEVTVDDG
jgi:hypothetical protein